jgi:uncharacterized repeat protein (TIGR01451 family)
MAVGAESTPVGLQLETIAEVRSPDRLQMIPATQLHVGAEIFYTVKVRNITDAPLRGVVVVKAVPSNTRYVADSAAGPGTAISLSNDGVNFVTEDQGTAAAWSHIRWQFRHPLAPGAVALLRFRGVFQ